MKDNRIVFIAVWLLLLLCSNIWARPATEYDAEMIVSGWLKTTHQPLDATLGRRIKNIETFTGDSGRTAYYIVNLQPSGYVIVSADDRIEPIIGFSADGIYDFSFENPLVALTTNDLSGRIESFRNTYYLQAEAETQTTAESQGKWRHFINLAGDSEGRYHQMSLTNPGDIRVLPLVRSQWGQAKACGDNLFNYYTPGNYPCGCLATAMAQVMRYYEYPTGPIGVHEYAIDVSGLRKQNTNTRGGDGLGGAYSWSDMPLRPSEDCNNLTEIQRQAIGALCYDTGIAVEMQYESDGSGALMPDAKEAMVDLFQYSNVVLGYDSSRNIHSVLKEMINPNLDAKAPVILAISDPFDPNGGHAVVCDGYGYESSTLYHHLNMGWNGTDDIWYNLPDIDAVSLKYTTIFGCLYNISTAGAGEIISGRVLGLDGRPVINAKVSAEPGGRTPLVTFTDDRGIYALENLKSDTTYTIWPSAEGYVFSRHSVETLSSDDNSTWVGNRWGVDFYAESAPNPSSPDIFYVDNDSPGDPGPDDTAVSDPGEDGSIDHPFDAIQEAIDMAFSQDTVVVMPGIYTGRGNRDLDFDGKAITVRGEDPNNPNLVIINAEGTAENPHRGFVFHRYETPNSVLTGLTITGGYHELGGGMYCGEYARPTVTGCVFRENFGSLGGGLYNESNPTLTNCTFIENFADGGGGIYNSGQEPECKPVINDCLFIANAATHNGGAMYNLGRYSGPMIMRCEFIRNFVSGGGGAIRNNMGSSSTLINCLIAENSAATFGGAIRNSNSSAAILTNCTLSGNTAKSGRALACNQDDGASQSPGVFLITNCIFWNSGDEIFIDDKSVVNVTYSNVQGGSTGGPWPGQGNIDVDPHFADPGNDDYHLASRTGRWDPMSRNWIKDMITSPCVDAGDANTPVNLEPYPNGGIVNMGAYGGTEEASKS
ncbi:MAG: C10 family peptidase [Sedimentisphaerales bacterium]|nr:C10 family peptidase [Sedimentisphaerales bacterium]